MEYQQKANIFIYSETCQ